MSAARFIVTNARVTRITRRERVTFLTLSTPGYKAGAADYFDVTCFATLDLPAYVVENAVVTLKGDLSRRKPREGSREWTTELVGRAIEPGDEALAVPARRTVAASTSEPEASDDVPF